AGQNQGGGETMIKPNAPYRPKRLEGQRDRQQRRAPGKRSRTRTSRKQGRYITSRPARRVTDLALDATLREAAPYQRERREAAAASGASQRIIPHLGELRQ